MITKTYKYNKNYNFFFLYVYKLIKLIKIKKLIYHLDEKSEYLIKQKNKELKYVNVS